MTRGDRPIGPGARPPIEPGEPAPRLSLPGVPAAVDTDRLRGAPYVVEFLRGTW